MRRAPYWRPQYTPLCQCSATGGTRTLPFRCRPQIAKLEAQYAHFREVYGQRADPATAWLAFRMLLASLAAAASG